LVPNQRQKYVLIRMADGLVLRGDPAVQWHKDIVDGIEADGDQILEVLGGGWIFENTDENTLYIWGKSDRYGEAPTDLVQELLASYASEIKIKREEVSA